VTSQGD